MYTHSYSFNTYIRLHIAQCTYTRLSVPLGCLLKQAGINIHTILNMLETPGNNAVNVQSDNFSK